MERQNSHYPYERGIIVWKSYDIDTIFYREHNKIFIIKYSCSDNKGLNEMFQLNKHNMKVVSVTHMLSKLIKLGNYTKTETHKDIFNNGKIVIRKNYSSGNIEISLKDDDKKYAMALFKHPKRTIRRIKSLYKYIYIGL
jgi:hypothetical protein